MVFSRITLWVVALLSLWTLGASAYTFDPTVLAIPSLTYGTANETCETPSGADVTLTTGGAWEAAIEGASPGARFFLRTGTYTTSVLTLPNGTVNSRITVKAYNCEVVTLNATVDPANYTTIAGVITNSVRFIRGTTYTGVIVRNNHIRSNGNTWAIRNDDDQVDLLIDGNVIETTLATDDVNTIGVRAGSRGTNAVITRNKILNSAPAAGGEDLIQFYNWSGTWTISRNWFVQNDEEDFMDIKYSTVGAGHATIRVYENYFNGAAVQFQCVMTHNASDVGVNSGYSYTADVKGNYFYQCPRPMTHRISTGTGENDPDGRFLVFTYNVVNNVDTVPVFTIESHNATIEHNTILRGNFKPGVTGTNPLNVIVRNNIFYQSLITFGSNIDTCSHNDFYQVTGAPTCTSSLTGNPLFVNVASDWNLQSASPARNAGSDSLDLGAYGPPSVNVTSALELHLKFDENTGSTAQDSTANNHDGTLDTGATWGAAKLGVSALTVDGTTDGVVTVSGLLGNPASVTLAAWFKRSAFPTAEGDLLSIGNFVILRNSATAVLGRFYNGSTQVTTSASFASGTTAWQHVVYTFTPGAQRLYLNGLLAASGSAGGAISYTGVGTNTVLGGHGAGSADFRFQGSLDDVRVYSRALTASDVAGLYALTDPPPLSVQVTSPTTNPSHSVTSTPLTNFSGVATDSTGVTGVTWSCPTCTPTSGTATCTPACGGATTSTTWSVASIGLAVGSNLLTVTAADASGTQSDTLTVTYTPPSGGGGAACTHYASSETAPAAGFAAGLQGNTGTSQSSPKRVVDMWSMLTPGRVLCLLNGTYTGGNSLLQVPSTVNGTLSQPVTIRALNDGQVVINGGTARPIQVLGNYIHIQGVDASGGDNATCPLNGSFGKLSRVVCYEGGSTAATSGFRFGGPNNVLEDVAWFGRTKKGINCGADYIGVGNNTVRRAFALYTDSDPSAGNPTNTYELGYGQDRCTFENVIGTWNTKPGGGVGDPEGVLETFRTEDSAILGSIFYVKATDSYPASRVFFGLKDAATHYQAGNYHPMHNMLVKHTIALMQPGHPSFNTTSAWGLAGATNGPPGTNNRVEDSMGVSGLNTAPSGDGGWTRTNFRHGTTVAAALSGSGHTSVWTLYPGLCKQYVDRTLTTAGLWPWKMNQRIINAMNRAGKTPIDVTMTMQSLFGTIPAGCLSGSVEEETCTPPLVGTPPNCSCPAGTVPPNCEPETPAETCPPDCPVQDTFVVATTGSPGPTGSDSAACTLEAPCATINHVCPRMTPGDTLYARGGTYTGAGNRINTSTCPFPAGNDWNTPTRIAAYGGETVVLQQSTGTVITVNNPATDRYLVFDRLIVDGATTGGNDTQGVVISGGAHHIRWQNGTIRNTHFTGLTITDASAVEVLQATIHGSSHGSGASVTGASDSVLVDGVTFHTNASHGLNAAHSGLSNLTVRNSVSRNNAGTGFQLGASNLLAANLLAYSNALGVRLTSVTVDGKLYHATVADNSGVEVQIDAGATDTLVQNVIAVGGIVDNGTGTVQTTNLVTDPGFVGGGNYHLALDTSPAIDEGTCLPGVVDVALDTIPRPQPTGGECDIGVYEQIGDEAEPPLPTPGALSARPWGSRLFLLPQ